MKIPQGDCCWRLHPPPKKKKEKTTGEPECVYTPLFEREISPRPVVRPIIFEPPSIRGNLRTAPEAPHHTLCRWPHLLWIQGSLGPRVAARETPKFRGFARFMSHWDHITSTNRWITTMLSPYINRKAWKMPPREIGLSIINPHVREVFSRNCFAILCSPLCFCNLLFFAFEFQSTVN